MGTTGTAVSKKMDKHSKYAEEGTETDSSEEEYQKTRKMGNKQQKEWSDLKQAEMIENKREKRGDKISNEGEKRGGKQKRTDEEKQMGQSSWTYGKWGKKNYNWRVGETTNTESNNEEEQGEEKGNISRERIRQHGAKHREKRVGMRVTTGRNKSNGKRKENGNQVKNTE